MNKQTTTAIEAILRGSVILRLYFGLKNCISMDRLDADMAKLYTFLLLIVFTQRNFVADFIRLKLHFIQNAKIVF